MTCSTLQGKYAEKLEREKEELQAEIEELKVDNNWWQNRYNAEYKIVYEDLKPKIDKAIRKIENMFDRGDETTLIDDLLELEEILGVENE